MLLSEKYLLQIEKT